MKTSVTLWKFAWNHQWHIFCRKQQESLNASEGWCGRNPGIFYPVRDDGAFVALTVTKWQLVELFESGNTVLTATQFPWLFSGVAGRKQSSHFIMFINSPALCHALAVLHITPGSVLWLWAWAAPTCALERRDFQQGERGSQSNPSFTACLQAVNCL